MKKYVSKINKYPKNEYLKIISSLLAGDILVNKNVNKVKNF